MQMPASTGWLKKGALHYSFHYSCAVMLPGWERHFVYCYPLDQYFWNRFSDQGKLVGTKQARSDYTTALIGNKTVEWLRSDAIPESQKVGGKPFFAYVPIHPPHGVTTPAPWYNESWPDLLRRPTLTDYF